MQINKISILTSFSIFVSCANVRKYGEADYIPIREAKKLEGNFENIPFNLEYRTYNTFDNAINWRKKKSDTVVKFSSVNLKILDHRFIQFSFTNEKGDVKTITANYSIKEDGFVSIKNRNFRLTGLPFIFGDYEINKVELGLTNTNQLILNGTRVKEGAFLIIFWSPPGWKYLYEFERK